MAFVTIVGIVLFIAFTHADVRKDAINEASKRYGGCDSDPFPYLEQRHRGDKSNSFVTPTADGRAGLDTALACRLKKLLEFAESKGCRLSINSAMRPVQRCNQGSGACARQGNSCHQYGRAVDLGGTSQCLAWLTSVIGRQNENSPFKLHVAYVEKGNYRHVQCSEHPVANASSEGGCRGPCTGGISINPGDLSNIPSPGSFSPSSGISDSARDFSGGQQSGQPSGQPSGFPSAAQPVQQPAPQGQMCTLPDGKVVPCSAIANPGGQPGGAPGGPVGNPPPPTLPPSQQPGQYLQASESSPSPTPSSKSSTDASIASLIGELATSSKKKTSAIDQINEIAGPTISAAESGTSAPLILTLSPSDAQTLRDEQIPAPTTSSTSSKETQAQLQPLGAQTFISSDLSQSPAQTTSQPRELSAFQTILASMKATLLNILAYLRPFGRPQTAQYDEWAE